MDHQSLTSPGFKIQSYKQYPTLVSGGGGGGGVSIWAKYNESIQRPCQGGGGSNVARLNFKMSCVSAYKCLSLIVGFAVNVAIWPREVVSCRNFILRAVATFWAMSLAQIYPGGAIIHC